MSCILVCSYPMQSCRNVQMNMMLPKNLGEKKWPSIPYPKIRLRKNLHLSLQLSGWLRRSNLLQRFTLTSPTF